jgi:hypothetical protein
MEQWKIDLANKTKPSGFFKQLETKTNKTNIMKRLKLELAVKVVSLSLIAILAIVVIVDVLSNGSNLL